MGILDEIISEKSTSDAQWRAARLAERENITALQDAGITEITSDPAQYARYLDLQSDNPFYSAGNIALVQMQVQNATIFGTAERWKALGRFVLDEERPNGAKIFTRAAKSKGYTISDAYDISQTQGQDVSPSPFLTDDKKMANALRVILNYTQVPVVPDRDLPMPAYYDQEKLQLAINPDAPEAEAFAAIATEIALVRFHNKGRSAGYSRADCELDAQSVSYILCRRFGIEREKPDMSRLPELYEGWPARERRQALDSIQDMGKMIGASIEKAVVPQQRSRPPIRRAVR